MLPAELAEEVAKRQARVARLYRFDWIPGPSRYWSGFGPIRTNDGQQWKGTGGVINASPITAVVNDSAPEQTFSLSGVTQEFIDQVKGETANWRGRFAFILLQPFDEFAQPKGLPRPIWWGVMSTFTVAEDRSEGMRTKSITLQGESVLVNRFSPRQSYWTDRDQQARFPGDKACERVMGMTDKTLTIPGR
ncbi:hypothetical protein [Ancylobacter defluvii]|uniref:Uncharacterized protein n=1 Tax=Ancylobacter defluvii TaxID=1282440 RepID=A0A9W6K481_9HYPH|nr:hypothetical protein [Ancylobacter defluvii]MBS7588296.1 hypothetical protein [Ancylobacter defluvii]GLK86693.1 hypothetical protein GCM10017653_47630 [Ancylobacter defluvii]